MVNQILMISDLMVDHRLGKQIATSLKLQHLTATDVNSVRKILVANPDALVFWNAEKESAFGTLADVLPKYAKASRLFVITDEPLGAYPHLLKYPFFGHHLQRRFDPPATDLYTALARGVAVAGKTLNLAGFFEDKGIKPKELVLHKSGHKGAAIQAIQSTLENRGIQGRLAKLIAQCTDELILNAIFDAPVDDIGEKVHHRLPRDRDFVLAKEVAVKIEFAAGENFMAIGVTDHFGTLDRVKLFSSLRPYLSTQAKGEAVDSTAQGFGINGILQSGMSVVFVCKEREKTEAILIFPIVKSFKDFRNSFRFFSMVN